MISKGVDKAVKTNADELPSVKQAVDELFKKGLADKSGCLNTSSPPRIAVYASAGAEPKTSECAADSPEKLMKLLVDKVSDMVKKNDSLLPLAAIREVIENLIHANFQEVVISVLEKGNVLRVSDRGPGIVEKKRALEPGFTTADSTTKGFIRGVGSGLPIASRAMAAVGGALKIEDNLHSGAVITLSLSQKTVSAKPNDDLVRSRPRLSKRQKKALFIVVEVGSIGPSRVATELSAGLSTAYRDLRILEEAGLVKCDKNGKRSITNHGINSLDSIMES